MLHKEWRHHQGNECSGTGKSNSQEANRQKSAFSPFVFSPPSQASSSSILFLAQVRKAYKTRALPPQNHSTYLLCCTFRQKKRGAWIDGARGGPGSYKAGMGAGFANFVSSETKRNTSKKPFFFFPAHFFTSSFEKVGEICSGTLEGGEGVESIRRAVVSGGGSRGESSFAAVLLRAPRINVSWRVWTTVAPFSPEFGRQDYQEEEQEGRSEGVLSFACSRQCRRCIDKLIRKRKGVSNSVQTKFAT